MRKDGAVLGEALTDQLAGRHLELLPGDAERRGERALGDADADRSRGGDGRNHDNGEPLPASPAESLEHNEVLLLGRTTPACPAWAAAWDGEKSYVLGKGSASAACVSS